LGEVYTILRETSEVVVVPWDATVYKPIVLRRPADVKRVKLTGGGGTCILPALKLVDEKYGDADMVVILSDWEISDLNSGEVQELLRKHSKKIVAVTTYKMPPEFLRSIKIELKG